MQVRLQAFATGHLSLLSRIQSIYSTEIYWLGVLSSVLTHIWKTFCSLHMICITCISLNRVHSLAVWATTKSGPTSYWNIWSVCSWGQYNAVLTPQCCFLYLNYINKCMIKSCTEALRQLFEAGWHSCIHVSLHTKSNVPLCSSGVN